MTPAGTEELEEFYAFAQPSSHHLRAGNHFRNDRGDLRRPEIEALIKFLDRVEDPAVTEMRIMQRRDLNAVIIDQVKNGVAVRMAVLFLLLGSGYGLASTPDDILSNGENK